MRKRERQQLIGTLIGRQRLATQGELAAALRKNGCKVTQATVSRDIRELGVQKGTGNDGKARFILPTPRERRDPEEVLARVLRDSTASIRQAQNLVVVQSEPGTAPAVGRAIDELGREEVVGTVAGDDTVMMAITDNASAKRIVKYLSDLAQR